MVKLLGFALVHSLLFRLSAAQSSSASPSNAVEDLSVIKERRVSSAIATATGISDVTSWLQTLDANGRWPDSEIDYTSGCTAQLVDWPAAVHWQRILTMAAAWHGGVTESNSTQFVKNPSLRDSISLAMEYWFRNDYVEPACTDNGGTVNSTCPCGTTGFWNQNWLNSVVYIPTLVGQVCLILDDTLTAEHRASCTRITGRAYAKFAENPNPRYLTGSNTLDVARIGVEQALLTSNVTLATDAYARFRAELIMTSNGTRVEGSFEQNGGILYNDLNAVLALETAAINTTFAATNESSNALATLLERDQWMIYRNVLTQAAHWDYSAMGRSIAFPLNDTIDAISVNLSQMAQLGELPALADFAKNLTQNSTSANGGNLLGNRMFSASDYMVHRGKNYVTSVKMFSSRTFNTECVNGQNPLGFHLSDGAVHTYIKGNEYEDIAPAWDWNLIPGTTIDYNATTLDCASARQTGLEAFAGGVSTGTAGISAMRYTNPLTRSLKWQKAWFFLDDDVQHVMVSGLNSTTDAPLYSVLDQRLHDGPVRVDGRTVDKSFNGTARLLWHGNVGYIFADLMECDVSDDAVLEGETTLFVQTGNKTGNWSAIGTSVQPIATVDLFSAGLVHEDNDPISYSVMPGVSDFSTFQRQADKLQIEALQNNDNISAIFDYAHQTFYGVFWDAGSVRFARSWKPNEPSITLTTDGNSAIIYNLDTGNLTVSDPSQTLANLTVTLTNSNSNQTMSFALPSDGLAGQSMSGILKV